MTVRDVQIQKRLFEIIREGTGKTVLKSPPSESSDPYVLGQKISTTSIDQFIKLLQVKFEVVARTLSEANEIAADIIDLSNRLYDDNSLNLTGDAPELDGMMDDSQNGLFTVSFFIQIGYLG